MMFAFAYHLRNGPNYRLSPTNTTQMNLEVNGVTVSSHGSRNEAMMAAVFHAESLGTHDYGQLRELHDIRCWQEISVIVENDEE
jgi:hypothetical protein